MSALITIAVLVFLGLWASATYARLLRLRRVVKNRWREVSLLRRKRDDSRDPASGPVQDKDDPAGLERALEQARLRYNEIAVAYNRALTTLPSSLVAGLAGFKHAALLAGTLESDNGGTSPT